MKFFLSLLFALSNLNQKPQQKMDYESLRRANIARNNAKLRELGLDRSQQLRASIARKNTTNSTQRKKRKRTAAVRPTAPTRRSRRKKNLAPPIYTPQTAEDDRKEAGKQQREEIKNGWRSKDGTWRGEVFGSVPGIKIGTVFGAGDYQRAGRFQMAKTGFFKPIVTCEWIDTTTKEVFGIVVNNDNGLSTDVGDVIEYAGAGGRRRGQNRTAEQCFHQTWESSTNAALRRNCASGRPVRIVRGPKCKQHGTQDSGGGYRYDGLFKVVKAEMRENGARKLRTAMFTLCRLKGKK